MQRARIGKLILIAFPFALLAQRTASAPKWMGTWDLDIQKSVLPPDLDIVNKRMTLEQAHGQLRLTADSTSSGPRGPVVTHDDESLNLDGMATVNGRLSSSFRSIDEAGFDILRKAKDASAEVNIVSRFAASPDGWQLIQTNTQVVSENGVVVRTIKWLFVFRRPQ